MLINDPLYLFLIEPFDWHSLGELASVNSCVFSQRSSCGKNWSSAEIFCIRDINKRLRSESCSTGSECWNSWHRSVLYNTLARLWESWVWEGHMCFITPAACISLWWWDRCFGFGFQKCLFLNCISVPQRTGIGVWCITQHVLRWLTSTLRLFCCSTSLFLV